MITTISSGRGIHVNGGYSSLPYINTHNLSAGLVRYNGNNFEVYDGSSCFAISPSIAHVELDNGVYEIIEWAKQKMEEEAKIKKLAETIPVVADLQSKLDMLVVLLQDYPQLPA